MIGTHRLLSGNIKFRNLGLIIIDEEQRFGVEHKEKLKALGVSGLWAQSRVDSLTEEEVHALAERIDAMPAGGALSQMDMVIVLLIAILVAILL